MPKKFERVKCKNCGKEVIITKAWYVDYDYKRYWFHSIYCATKWIQDNKLIKGHQGCSLFYD